VVGGQVDLDGEGAGCVVDGDAATGGGDAFPQCPKAGLAVSRWRAGAVVAHRQVYTIVVLMDVDTAAGCAAVAHHVRDRLADAPGQGAFDRFRDGADGLMNVQVDAGRAAGD